MGRDSEEATTPHLPLLELFQQALPAYLFYGMTYDQYWNGDVSAHRAYREAHKLRLKEANQLAWIQGSYVYEAIMCAAPAIKAFSKQRARPYRKEPYDLDESDRRHREEREQRKRYEKIKERVAMFAEVYNKKISKISTPEQKGDELTDA